LDNDIELVEDARKGDMAAFKKLVLKHKNNVYALAHNLTRCREDAEDVSQEVFIKVYRSLDRFKGESRFSTWLYRITLNTCLSLRSTKSYSAERTNANMDEIAENNPDLLSTAQSDPEEKITSVFIQAHIEQALQKLSQQERIVFTMRNSNDMSFNEIVEILQLQPGTVRSLHFRALRKLRKSLSFYKNKS